jgi:hypothetical protein
MKIHFAKWLLFVAGIALAACETAPVITKSAQSDELRNATIVDVDLPAGCPNITKSFPAGKTTFNVHYREPTSNESGKPTANLAYTTIYLRSPSGQTKAIRIFSNDPHGGAFVNVIDIPLSGSEIALCITGTNQYGKEGQAGP